MITLGKRKLDIKMEDGSFVELIKKPKQEFGITTASHSSNSPSSLGKVIGMVATPNKTNGASRVVCLKVMKPTTPASLPTLNTINNNNSLLSKSVMLNNIIDIKPSPSKSLIVTSLSSPKPFGSTSLTSLRIKANNSPLNSITNIVVPIKQEKLSDTETTQKYQGKKECIIKPLSNLPKNFFFQTNNNNNNNGNNGNGTTRQKPVMRIVSLQSSGIKQEKGFGGEYLGHPAQKIKKLKMDETLQPVRLKVISPMKAKPIVVVSPLNYHAHKQEEDARARLDLEDLMIKTSIKTEQPSQQEYVHASLWYDKDQGEFTASNFLTDSPICLLKNMLISGDYLTEQDSVNYLFQEHQIAGESTLKQLGVSSDYMLVDIKFIFRKQDTISIVIYSIMPSAVTMMSFMTDDQNNSDIKSEELPETKRKRSIKKRKDKSALTSCDKGRSTGGRIQLWQFLLTTLLEGQHPDKIEWTSDDGEFKFSGPDPFAKVWGAFKGKKNMTYNNLSRAIRYYYEMGIMNKVKGHQFRYKFTLDIKATTGYTFAEIRQFYEKDSLDPNCPNWGRFIALRELLGSPIAAQTNVRKIEDSGVGMEVESEAIQEPKSDFEEDLGHDQSLYSFGEDQLATTNLAQLLGTVDDAYLGYSLEDPS